MKKTILFLGLAAMISATPVFAATHSGKPVMIKHAAAMCMVKGKKVACVHHAKRHVIHHVKSTAVAKPAVAKKAY